MMRQQFADHEHVHIRFWLVSYRITWSARTGSVSFRTTLVCHA